MHFFKYGKQVAYSGGNKKDSIVQWLRRHSQPSTTELATVEAVIAKQAMVPVMLVGYFPSATSVVSSAKKAFYQAAEHKESLNFFHTESVDVAQHLGLDSDGIAVVKKFDELHHELKLSDFETVDDGEVAVALAVTEFVTAMTYPLVSLFSKEKAREIFSPRIMVRNKSQIDRRSDGQRVRLTTITVLH